MRLWEPPGHVYRLCKGADVVVNRTPTILKESWRDGECKNENTCLRERAGKEQRTLFKRRLGRGTCHHTMTNI